MHTKMPNRSKYSRVWLILSVLVVVLAEVAFTTMVVRSRGLFEYIGLDYRGSRAAGEAILEHGLGAAYNSQILEESQRRLFDRYVIESEEHGLPFYVVPAPYPPPFTLAFVPSTWLPPVPGYLVWTLFHALVLAVYQLRLARAFGVSKPGWLIAAVVLSFPAFINLIMGQISVWLVVFFGEAVIAFDRHQRFRTGVWLGLLVCKPQVLVLFLPALVLARQWRVLLGMVALVVVLIVPTLVFAGDWVAGFTEGILSAAGSTGTVMNIFPSSMTNWRAFGVNAARLYPSSVVWGFALTAMIATGIAGLSCSIGLRTTDRHRTAVAWLGLAAATCAFTWHAHVHQLLLLVPPLYAVLAAVPRLTRISHQLSAAASDTPRPAEFSRLGVLDVLSSTTPRPSDRKHRWARHLAALATKAGEKRGLKDAVTLWLLGSSAIFVLAAFTLSIGEAHDILGVTLLACLVAVTTVCVLALRSSGTSHPRQVPRS